MSIRLLALVSLSLVVTGCHFKKHAEVSGSGNRAVQQREVSPFTSISTQGAFTIEVVCQKDFSVEVEGDDNILPIVSSEVSNGVLYLKNTKSYSVRQPVTFRISVPNLDAISISGAGSFDISGIKNEKFEIDCEGAASIRASGTTKVLDIDTSGAAKIDTQKLHASRAIVDSKGVSKIDLDVADQLDVTISGPSLVTYQGSPVVNKTVNGPGRLEKRGSDGA